MEHFSGIRGKLRRIYKFSWGARGDGTNFGGGCTRSACHGHCLVWNHRKKKHSKTGTKCFLKYKAKAKYFVILLWDCLDPKFNGENKQYVQKSNYVEKKLLQCNLSKYEYIVHANEEEDSSYLAQLNIFPTSNSPAF